MKGTFVFALVLAVGLSATAGPVPLADGTIDNNDQSGTRDCAGGATTVSGNSNTFTLKNCAKVLVSGNENTLTLNGTSALEVTGNENKVQAGTVKSIIAQGNQNTITYRPGAKGKKPSISNLGTGNKISAAK
jgi:hypothetical protein